MTESSAGLSRREEAGRLAPRFAKASLFTAVIDCSDLGFALSADRGAASYSPDHHRPG
jgi:hypothetical protein